MLLLVNLFPLLSNVSDNCANFDSLLASTNRRNKIPSSRSCNKKAKVQFQMKGGYSARRNALNLDRLKGDIIEMADSGRLDFANSIQHVQALNYLAENAIAELGRLLLLWLRKALSAKLMKN